MVALAWTLSGCTLATSWAAAAFVDDAEISLAIHPRALTGVTEQDSGICSTSQQSFRPSFGRIRLGINVSSSEASGRSTPCRPEECGPHPNPS
ncbi:hypothetical protein BC827DRAFT_1253584 [Russula dissimulans]|nr:hypothetical protein BC827DRAFT_1253584 [Russula dissimulans]